VPVSSPKTLGILLVRSLAVNFDSYNRLSRPQNGVDNIFDLLCKVRNRFAYRFSNMISNGNTSDFSQMLIYQKVTAIRAEERETYRCGLINQLKLWRGQSSDLI
jgi:hypothetical protein